MSTYSDTEEDLRYGSTSSKEPEFPTTRYQGSKQNLIEEIWDSIGHLDFDSVLDLFAGTGSFSYKSKLEGKKVVYNDFLSFNGEVGKALIEAGDVKLSSDEVKGLLKFDLQSYPQFIRNEFEGIYFTDEENAWLDKMRKNIVVKLDNKYKKAIAISAIGQACITKRPYGLFHRANLYMRQNDVERSFGNKTTWERPFERYFPKFVGEFNNATFDNSEQNSAYSKDAISWKGPDTDLVYLDPPYYKKDASSPVSDYYLYYHFLDGYVNYATWGHRIDRSVKTKQIEHSREPWNNPDRISKAFEQIFRRYSDRHIVLSYNTASLPQTEEIVDLLSRYKENVETININHRYALQSSDSIEELLFVAYD